MPGKKILFKNLRRKENREERRNKDSEIAIDRGDMCVEYFGYISKTERNEADLKYCSSLTPSIDTTHFMECGEALRDFEEEYDRP